MCVQWVKFFGWPQISCHGKLIKEKNVKTMGRKEKQKNVKAQGRKEKPSGNQNSKSGDGTTHILALSQ